MVSKFAILVNILFASGVLAVTSSSRLETRLAHRRENHQYKPINLVYGPADGAVNGTEYTEYSANWAGAILTGHEGTFTNVTGTFIVPTPTGPDGTVAAWVGIDGNTCGTTLLRTGVDFTISGGNVSYHAWYAWYPEHAHDFHNLTINAGDEVRTTVTAFSKTSGEAIIENLSSGHTVKKKLSSSYPLCEQEANWLMTGERDGRLEPLVNFGTFKFTNATASGSDSPGKNYTLDGATIYDIYQNSSIIMAVSASEHTVTFKMIE